MSNILCIDFGSTYTKVVALDVEREEVLGTACGATTVADITAGLNEAVTALYKKTGKITFSQTLGCSSAAGGLKMIAVGLVPELTAEAAKRAVLGSGAKILKVFSHELSEYEIAEMAALAPDIILLAGGTDGGNKEVILHNAKMLAALDCNVPIVVAGNKTVAPLVSKILSETKSDVICTENVMPRLNELNITPASYAIRDVFLRRIIQAKGLNKAIELVDRPIIPTPAAVLKAAELLGRGTNSEAGLGELILVDIGGATTDFYSIAKGDPTKGGVMQKGLPEPIAKRTVEGDIGMRYSARSLLKAAGADLIAKFAQVNPEAVLAYIDKVEATVGCLPMNDEEKRIENGMARACVKVAADRHVGYLDTCFTISGPVVVQTGKDLTSIKTVVGTGGVIIGSRCPEEILKGVVFEDNNPQLLKPSEPSFYLDAQYIMAAMGLFGDEHPDAAVRIMKKHIVGGDNNGIEK